MGVEWGGTRRMSKWSCQICHQRLGLLERLADVRVCDRCQVQFPIIRRSTPSARDDERGSSGIRRAAAPGPGSSLGATASEGEARAAGVESAAAATATGSTPILSAGSGSSLGLAACQPGPAEGGER